MSQKGGEDFDTMMRRIDPVMWWREYEEHTEMVREIVKKMVGIRPRPISSLPLFRWARMQRLKMLAKKNVNRFRVQILLN